MATRREFLAGASAACLGAFAPPAFAANLAPRLISAAKLGRRDGGVLWSVGKLTSFDLPARGHAPVRLNDGRVLVMSRRPGLFASMLDPLDPVAPVSTFAPSGDSRFAGHAAVSPDGTQLVTSEFDATSFAAGLVLRDPKSGTACARWQPGGIEPHELVFARSGARLVAALGGLIEDGGVAGPAFNPGGIDSAVLELDPASGKVLARHKLPDSFSSLSLRHLAVAADGETVAVAAQDQDITITRPLVGLLRLGKGIALLAWPDPRECDFRSYVGSVAVSGDVVAAASPRGGVAGFWSLHDGRWQGSVAIADVCGLAAAAERGAFWASSGHGGIFKLAANTSPPRIESQWHADVGFDNHLLPL
jgi:hypothetical protein